MTDYEGTPAPAGIGRGSFLRLEIINGYPRASGDRPGFLGDGGVSLGVPPRQRGSATFWNSRFASLIVSPAPAGIGLISRKNGLSSLSQPRASGDRPASLGVVDAAQESAPRQRGSASLSCTLRTQAQHIDPVTMNLLRDKPGTSDRIEPLDPELARFPFRNHTVKRVDA